MEIETEYQAVLKQLRVQFGEDLELKGILFLIGVQELGIGRKIFSKQEKTELLHVAVCRLLEEYGYYKFEGKDSDGWPHWTSTEKLPSLKPLEQERLIKQAIVNYFQKQISADN